MYLMRSLVVAMTISAAGPALLCAAQAERAPRPRPDQEIVAEIVDHLGSKDPARIKQAMESIRERMRTRGLYELRGHFIRSLQANQMNQEITDLALEGILAQTAQTREIESLLKLRIDALIALGKAEQALAESKSLFNVASMVGTAEAILTVAQCINAARPTDVAMFNRFREEQMAGADVMGAAQPATMPIQRSTVLDSIKVDPKVFNEAMAKVTGEDAQSLMARGNLLLLADRVKEARPVFERLYSLSNSDLTEASEALARLMKAEDGTIGRANLWIATIRPKKVN